MSILELFETFMNIIFDSPLECINNKMKRGTVEKANLMCMAFWRFLKYELLLSLNLHSSQTQLPQSHLKQSKDGNGKA